MTIIIETVDGKLIKLKDVRDKGYSDDYVIFYAHLENGSTVDIVVRNVIAIEIRP